MTIAIIVVIYILGVFAARHGNKRAYRVNTRHSADWKTWLLSWIGLMIWLRLEYDEKDHGWESNWFTGKYWKDEK